MRKMKLPVPGWCVYLAAGCVLAATATQHATSSSQDKSPRSKRHTTLEDMAHAPGFLRAGGELVFSNQTGAVLPCTVAGELKRALLAAGERLTTTGPDINLAADEPPGAGARLDKLPAGLQVRWERDNGEPIQQLLAAERLSSSSAPEEGRPIRWQRSSDGALVFEPFRAHEFRPDLHLTAYRCVASFAGGAMRASASLMGPEMRVRALVQGSLAGPLSSSFLQAEVLDELVLEGSSAHFRCQVPSQARDLLQVVEWTEYPSEASFSAPSTTRAYMSQLAAHTRQTSNNRSAAQSNAIQHAAQHGQAPPASRYFVDPLTGDLHILNVDSSFSFRAYKCTCRHRITGELVSSANRGKLIVTESHSPVAPRPSGVESARAAVRMEGELALLSCDVQAYPRAHFTWWRRVNDLELEPVGSAAPDERREPGLVQLANLLLFQRLNRNQSGTYVCLAKNSAGEERLEQDLVIRAPLKASLSSSARVLELGKSLALECTVSGFPIHQMVFRHNLNIIKSIRSTKVASQQPSYFVVDERPEAAGSDSPSAATQPAPAQPQSQQPGPQQNNNNQEDKLSHAIVILLEPERAGAYQCFAYNQYESVQASTYIRILDDPPKFKETFSGELVEPGAGLSLRCSARANPLPEITWSVDEEPLPEGRVRFGDFVTKDGLVVSYVNISQTQPIDGGLYRCTADNGLAQVSHQAHIQVRGPAQVKPMPNITVLASSRLRYRCPAVGYPLGEIHWLHNGRRLPANHRQHVHENGTLEVEHMERAQADQGEYVCVVHPAAPGRDASAISSGASSQQRMSAEASYLGELGGASGPARGSLFVSIKARPVIEPFSFSRALQESQRASITCTISSGDLPITFEWLHNGRPIVVGGGSTREPSMQAPQVGSLAATSTSGNPGPDQQALGGLRLSQATDYSTTLLFESLVVQHSGNYTCVARNDAGSVSHQALMTVQVAPKWFFEPADTNVVRGSSMSINCMASGFPPPRIIWTKASGATGDSNSAGSAHKSVAQLPASWVYENGSLNILDARDSDLGYYMCQASNGVGPGLSKVIQVTVNVAAQFGTRQGVQHARRADPATLKCVATGDAPLQIYWFKNRHRLEAVNELQVARGGAAAAAAAEGGAGAHEQLSASQASVLLRAPVPGLSSISHHLAASARSPVPAILPLAASSPLEQLEALLAAAPKQQGLLLERYSLETTELLPVANHRLDPQANVQGAKQRLELLKTLSGSSVHKHQLQQQQQQQQPLLIQVSSTLTISQTDRQDTASFKCVAANHFGLDERSVQLVVQEAPSSVEELSVLEVSSRTITLAWFAPFDGNSPILSYRIQSRSENDSLEQGWTNHTVIMSNNLSPANDSALALIGHLDEAGSGDTGGLVYQGARSGGLASQQLAGSTRSATRQSVVALKPQTHYWFRLAAENRFGMGPLSNAIEAITQDEAPGAAPNKLRAVAQSSSSLLISWQRPSEKEIFGPILGYHIAYKALPNEQIPRASTGPTNSSSEPQTNTYKSVQHDNKLSKFDALLTGLRKSSNYLVSVQAFNNRGTGPATDPIVVRTLDMDPPRQLKLFVRQTTNCSIQIEWRPLSQIALSYQQQQQQQQQHQDSSKISPADAEQHHDHDQVDYYSLYQAELNAQPQWTEVRLPGHATSHNIDGLKCGTRYQFYMMGANKIGLGDQSDILETKTTGGSPLPPDIQSAFDVINATCYIIRLDRWQDTGCPIRRFDLRYKANTASEFQQLGQYQLLPSIGPDQSDPRATGDGQLKSESMQKRRVQRSSDYSGPEAEAEEPLMDYSLKDYIIDSKLALLGPPVVEPGSQLFNFLKDSMQVLDSPNEAPTSRWYQQQQENLLEQPADWRRVKFCGLVDGLVYTVRIAASSSVGETEEDYNILASPEGLKNDPANQRQVVGKLGSRDNRLADSYNLSINGSLFALSQWPVLVPLVLTLAMMAIIMLGALLLRRSHPPGSNSSTTTTGGVGECQRDFLAERMSFKTGCNGNGVPPGAGGAHHGELVFSADGYGHPIYQHSRGPNMYDESAYGMLNQQLAPGQPANSINDPSSNRSTSSPATTTTANTANSIHSASQLAEAQVGSSVHLRGSSGAATNSALNLVTKPAQSVYMCAGQKAADAVASGASIKELFYGAGGSQQPQAIYQPSHQVVQVKHYQAPQAQPASELNELGDKAGYFQAPIYGRETVGGLEKADGCFMSLVEEVARANDAIQRQQNSAAIKQDQSIIEQVAAGGEQTGCNQAHCLGQHIAEVGQESQNYALVTSGHHTTLDNKLVEGARLSYDPVYATIRRTFPQAFRYLTLPHHQQVAEHGSYCQRSSLEEGVSSAQRLFSNSNGQLVHDLAHFGSNNFNSLNLANPTNVHNQPPND